MNLQFLKNPQRKKKKRKKAKKKVAAKKKSSKIKSVKKKTKEGSMAKKKKARKKAIRRKKATSKRKVRKKAPSRKKKKVSRKKVSRKKVSRKKPTRRKATRKKASSKRKTTRRKTKKRSNPKNPTKVTVKASDKRGKRAAQATTEYPNQRDLYKAQMVKKHWQQKKTKASSAAAKKRWQGKINTLNDKIKKMRSKKHMGKAEIREIRAYMRRLPEVSTVHNNEYSYSAYRRSKKAGVAKTKRNPKRRKKSMAKKRKVKKRKSMRRKRKNPTIRRKKRNPIVRTMKNPSVLGLTGHQVQELGYLAAAGVTVDVVGSLAMQIPGVSKLKDMVGQASPQLQAASGSVVSLGIGVLGNVLLKQYGKGAAGRHLSEYSKALVAASVVKIAASFSGTLMQAAGMSGVKFTPNMGAVKYTPLSGSAPQLGAGRDLYKADFGRHPSADYGGGGGYTDSDRFSHADFDTPDNPMGRYPQMGNSSPQMGVYPQGLKGVDFHRSNGLTGYDEQEPILDQSMGMC